MKPCAAYRKPVALLAAAALSDAESGPIQEHLHTCPGCRAYLAQISAISADHSAAASALPAVEVRPRLYQRVAAAIRSSPTAPGAGGGMAWAMGRFQLAGVASLLFVAALGSLALLKPSPSTVVAPVKRVATLVPPAETGGTRLVAYRLALNRSPEALDQLLAAEAARPFHSATLPVPRNLARSDAGF